MNDFLMNLALLTILVLAIPLVATKVIDGVYLAFLALAILASFEAIQPLAQAFQFLGHSLAAAERLFGVTDAAPQVLESAAPLPGPSGHTLEFDDVHFAYDPDAGTNPSFQSHRVASAEHSGGTRGEGEVLCGITFTVRPGSRVAVVGPSGSGKSTLVRLALRFWDPTEGAIRLDGQDIREDARGEVRGVIVTVSEDTHVFIGTMRDNFMLARPEAAHSK